MLLDACKGARVPFPSLLLASKFPVPFKIQTITRILARVSSVGVRKTMFEVPMFGITRIGPLLEHSERTFPHTGRDPFKKLPIKKLSLWNLYFLAEFDEPWIPRWSFFIQEIVY